MSGSGNQIDFNEAMAKQWRVDVQVEIDAVERLLDDVASACQEIPGEDDTIMTTIYDVGTELQEKWKNLISGFKALDDVMGEVTNKYVSKIAKSMEQLTEFKNNIRL